ncbi:hypothetical protein [Methanosphaera sp. BMS]|uniref:hypothetical protein n=1 Tax=Methanosphaera sp. BMS TaxID=1789762 RepID=UPI000DC1C37F|nr:hypothetical protein [Methanosphaera sp. BMS]AWX31626.1 hypothetical protein AW729_00360 [Methanosphaera sp. BMS]
MVKIKQVLLFTAILILLVGVACASDVSEDTASTGSIAEEAAIHDIHKLSDNANSIQDDKINENIQTSKSSDNKVDENTTKTIEKDSNTNVKTATTINNWKELQTAVNNMKKNENLTLILGEGTYINTGTITVYKSNSSLTIDGNGQTINGNKKQLFSVNGSTSLVLKNIIITNGSSYDGGAIINHEKLTIINSTLANNSANNYGGAIRNRYGTLTIINSTLVNNTATYGGAIDNYEKTIITNSTLANNSAKYGGAINDDGRLTITGSTLANNTATYDGGAITHSLIRNYTIVNSNFTNNHAKRGGAIYSPGCLNLTKNIFTNNTADNKETIDYLSENFGGYFKDNVYKSTSIALKTNKLSINDNENFFSSEDEIVLNFSIAVEHPHYYDSDILERVDDITIYLNDKEYATTRYENYTLSNLKQGNYSVYYKAYNQKSNTIKFTVHNITNWQDLCNAVNVAKNQIKDITLTLQNGLYINTGTIEWINPNMTLTIDGNGQWIYGNQLQVFNINGRSSMILKNITIIGAKSTVGGAIQNKGKLTVIQSTLANNTADYGGAIENLGTLTVNQSVLTGNTAEDGGAIQNYGPFTIIDSTLSYNTASHYGGAIKNYQTLFTVTGSNITNNTAERGGAIFSNGKTNLTGNTFTNNTADNNETIDLNGYTNGHEENNTYISTEIAFRKMLLSIKDDMKTFDLGEDVALNYSFALKNPENYDADILDKLDDITIYVNDEVYATTDNQKNYTLTPSKPGKYNVYYELCNQKSNKVTFKVIGESQITTPENSYDYPEVIQNNITLNIIDPSGQEGTALITVKDASKYKQLLNLTNITDGYEIPTESIVNALKNIYDTLDGSYTIKITYSNDCIFSSSTEFALNIIKQANVNLSTQTTPTHLIVTVKDDKETPINYGTITTNITESNYYPDDNGQVFIALNDLEPGKYMANINYNDGLHDDVSANETFSVYQESDMINVTTSNVEMVNGKGVTFDAYVDYKNRTIKFGKVYFEIDGKPLVDEDGLVLYAPINDNWASLPYEIPKDLSLGNHTLTAVYIASTSIWTKDEKTLTIIENIPEGASDENQNPQEDEKQDTYTKDTRAHKTVTNTIQSNIPAIHQIIVGNIVIPADTVITLGQLNEMFGQKFVNGHLLLYIDGQLVYNGTVGDDLATVILEIIEKFLGEHELKVEFTDSNNQTQTYTKNVTIN